MVFHVLGALAQFYSENLSQETKKGKHERKAQGLYNGLLPFGVMKGTDGLPKAHDETWVIRDKKGNTTEERPPTYAGLLLAFQLAARGETDKAIAQALNTQGYRTHGTHGANPFSKDSIRGILRNRFYIGELPVGRRKVWTKAKHAPIIPTNLFDAALETKQSKHRLPQTIPGRGRKYSLSGIAKCAHCGRRLRVTDSHNPRMICSKRQDSGDCQTKSARIPYLESQMKDYFGALRVSQEYKDGMLALVRQPVVKDETTHELATIHSRLSRIKDLYAWGDLGREEYLAERQQLQAQAARLNPVEQKPDGIEIIAKFIEDLSLAWDSANDEQKNKLAVELFEAVWIENGEIVAVTPKTEVISFFDLIYARLQKDTQTGGSDGIRTRVLDLDRIACLATTPRSRY